MSAASVSVVIPTRDRPEMVEDAVRSVLSQTRPVDQIVVVDNGSEQAHSAVRSILAQLSPRIDVVRGDPPGGPAAARNIGLARASGEYIVFLDDDDLIHPCLVEEGLSVFAHSPELDAVVFMYECFHTPTAYEWCTTLRPPGMLPPPANQVRGLEDGMNPVPPAVLERSPVSAFLRFLIPINSCLIRRSAIGETRFPSSLPQGEDTYFWIALAAAGRRFRRDERTYAYVRRHPGNITRSRSRYRREIQACYEKLLADGLLRAPEDAYLAHLKLLWFRLLTGRSGWWNNLSQVLRAPVLFGRELVFWVGNLGARTLPVSRTHAR
jgi:glycosyltransferase involved in cell wall biosynthesis